MTRICASRQLLLASLDHWRKKKSGVARPDRKSRHRQSGQVGNRSLKLSLAIGRNLSREMMEDASAPVIEHG
jgi:hypothetical protein